VLLLCEGMYEVCATMLCCSACSEANCQQQQPNLKLLCGAAGWAVRPLIELDVRHMRVHSAAAAWLQI
jgi:hypothetical protein